KALTALRKRYASPVAAREGHAGTRNSVANLVIYAGSEEDAARATATMTELAGRHPSRTILLIADLAPGSPGVQASVSATCRLASGRRICYEEIRLRAAGASGPHLRSIVDPLLISDLPVFLWWAGDPPFRHDAFLVLARLSSRVLIDSGSFRTPTATLQRLGRFIEDDAIDVPVGDLNWNRLAPWREILAQLFDPPATGRLLPHVRRVRIERATRGESNEAPTAQSLLLAGWLASRLDWEPGRAAEETFSGAYRLRLRSTARDVVMELRSEFARDARPGDVQGIYIEADNGERRVAVDMSRSSEQEHAFTSVSVDGGPPSERSVRFPARDDAGLLGDEIDRLDADRVFEEAAEFAGRLATLLPAGADEGPA
ncbi:MAG TPA: glucose-6-phosphate dehydrogenase assembly protein OpcA, partial [Dehalococcoidia bacterium]